MQIKYSEIRAEFALDYTFEGEVITATYTGGNQTITDTFDFSKLQEDEQLVEVISDIPVPVIQSAERKNGELYIILTKPYGADVAREVMLKGDAGFPFSRDWQEVE